MNFYEYNNKLFIVFVQFYARYPPRVRKFDHVM